MIHSRTYAGQFFSAMLFASQMLVVTKAGFTYRQADYREWLREAGFNSVDIVPTPTPSTLVFAS